MNELILFNKIFNESFLAVLGGEGFRKLVDSKDIAKLEGRIVVSGGVLDVGCNRKHDGINPIMTKKLMAVMGALNSSRSMEIGFWIPWALPISASVSRVRISLATTWTADGIISVSHSFTDSIIPLFISVSCFRQNLFL